MAERIVSFGEIMLRLSPEGYNRFFQNDKLVATFGGSESNVATSLALFGLDSAYVTKLPEHAIGQAAVNSLRYFGVDTSSVVRGGERVGTYYIEKGASQRSSVCIYDRAGSAISKAGPADFDWRKILEGADWFHFSGITPALGQGLRDTLEDALQVAHKRGIMVSCDFNYRSKLWSREEMSKVINRYLPYVDVLYGFGPDDAKIILGAAPENGAWDREGYASVARQVAEKYRLDAVAITMRETQSASENAYAAMLYENGKSYFSKRYQMTLVDRVGGGDAFGAGLIYSLIKKKAPQDAIEFATAAAVLKHSIEGDLNRVSVAEVEKVASGNSAEIKR